MTSTPVNDPSKILGPPRSSFSTPTAAWETEEALAWLALLQSDQTARTEELLHCKKDPYRFLTHWCRTIDGADQDEPEKLFPDKAHLEFLTRMWQRYPVLLVPKARQMSCTWLFVGLYLWEAFFYGHRLTFFQSKKERDANELILRADQMYSSLPFWMREWNPVARIECYMEFMNSKSRIFGIPSGPDGVRGYQPTGVFSDEVVYQPDIDKLTAAVRPAIRGGGRLTMISSAGPGYFAAMVLDSN